MNAKGVAYIVAAIVLGVFVLANWTLFATAVELNLLIAQVQAPLIILMLLIAGVIWLVDLGVHALSRRAWVRERRALRKDLEAARQSALLGRPPIARAPEAKIARAIEPEIIPPRAATNRRAR